MRAVQRFVESTVQHFREHAFEAARPTWLAQKCLSPSPPSATIPAIQEWFATSQAIHDGKKGAQSLNVQRFLKHGLAPVPVERTQKSNALGIVEFERSEMTLSAFAKLYQAQQASQVESSAEQTERFYLAQCPISLLDPILQADLPTPELVLKTGRGDIYDSSVWLGLSPTYTPLHKDPNPNLLVQLAGKKIVRLLEPAIGLALFEEVQRRLGSQGSAVFRGQEMMQGREKAMLEDLVWGATHSRIEPETYESTLEPGEALFVPNGWWHSVKGIGHGINGSANWWFR